MTRIRIWSSALALGLLAACAPAATVVTPVPTDALAAAEQTITATDVYDRIAFLASDEMRGRDTPSPELERAAEYIAAEFRAMGLEPAGDPDSFMQRWPYRRVAMDAANVRLTVEAGGQSPTLALGRDFFSVPASRDTVSGTPVFVGPIARMMPGFPADVADRIPVVALRAQFGDEIFTVARSAAQAGARAIVFALHPTHSEPVIQQIAAQLRGIGIELPIPVVGVRFDHAQAMIQGAGLDPAMLTDAAHARSVVLTDATIRMATPLLRTEALVPNVAALLRGRDPVLRDEYIVLSAHFDHVGVGQPDAVGDSIYNGADDNASGTSVMLEVAQAMAALPPDTRPRRSIIFLGVSGEEKGLLGSGHFAENPTVPIEQIVANINMDMVGRNAPNEVIAIGPEYTDLGETAHRIASQNPALGLSIVPDEMPEEMLFFRSDHVNFVRQDIPAIFFFTGLHEDYHRPSDTVDRIDTDKAARIGRLIFRLTHEIATADSRPQWLPGQLDTVRGILETVPR